LYPNHLFMIPLKWNRHRHQHQHRHRRIVDLIIDSIFFLPHSSFWMTIKVYRNANFYVHHVTYWAAVRSHSGCIFHLFSSSPSFPLCSGKDPDFLESFQTESSNNGKWTHPISQFLFWTRFISKLSWRIFFFNSIY
jgi:hypothetical protein